MTTDLDLADIQGNIIRAYGRFGFPKARYFFLHIRDKDAGRSFVRKILPKVTNALCWEGSEGYPGEKKIKRPEVTFNIGFSFAGLEALSLPTRTLRAMPAEFMDGMRARCQILGDIEQNAPEKWDPIWQKKDQVHIWCSINAGMARADGAPIEVLEEQTDWLRKLCQEIGGVQILSGHGPHQKDFQEASALLMQGPDGMIAVPKEHFGFVDGISDPVFEGQFPPETMEQQVKGRGKFFPQTGWKPLATGEFLLGHINESQEISPSSVPVEFMRNGSFMVYRKLHQNVGSFNKYIKDSAKQFSEIMEMNEEDAEETLRAKLVGRWSNGAPLATVPTLEESRALEKRFLNAYVNGDKQEIAKLKQIMSDFVFKDDMDGVRCPLSSHIRRSNTRDMLDPRHEGSSALNKRRRILRRGLPYGSVDQNFPDDGGEQGIIFMAICTSLFRQFEFIQQQWMQHGMDFNAGNDTCPVTGHHGDGAKFVIPMDPSGDKPPFICSNIPQFVTTRGGEYFFLPSLTALRMIGMGSIDPT